jgi:hypothetical protein
MPGKLKASLLLLSTAAVAVVACARPMPRAAVAPRTAPAEVRRCATLSGAALGRLPLELDVGGRTVRLVEWTQGDESTTEVLGFLAQLPADVSYTVQAGGERFPARTARWLHPRGLVGPRVHPIEAIDFCRLALAAPAVAQR